MRSLDAFDAEVYRSVDLMDRQKFVLEDEEHRAGYDGFYTDTFVANSKLVSSVGALDLVASKNCALVAVSAGVLLCCFSNQAARPPALSCFVGQLTFFSFLLLDVIIQQIASCCLQLGYVADFDSLGFCFRCVSFAGSSSCTFKISIFSAPCGKGYVIEFQRQIGCACVFANTRKLLLNTLVGAGVFEKTCLSTCQLPLPCASLPSTFASVAASDMLESMRDIVEMSCSEFAGMQSESMMMLSMLSKKESNQRAILDAGGLAALVRCVQTSDCSTNRNAMCALSSLLSGKEAGRVVDEFLQLGGLSLLFQTLSSQASPVVREVTRVIYSLVSFDPKKLVLTGTQRDAICTLTRSDDQSIRQVASQIFVVLKI